MFVISYFSNALQRVRILYTADSIKVVNDNSQIYNMSAKRIIAIIIVLNNFNTNIVGRSTSELYLYIYYIYIYISGVRTSVI